MASFISQWSSSIINNNFEEYSRIVIFMMGFHTEKNSELEKSGHKLVDLKIDQNTANEECVSKIVPWLSK